MKTSGLYLLIGFLTLSSFSTIAQQKYEREYKVKPEQIPQSAKEFINAIKPKPRIKWFKEVAIETVSLEAKFKHNNQKFSVEFDTLGVLQDVEILIKKNKIAPEVYQKINASLDDLYQKWKFEKIQTHYSGSDRQLITLINENIPSEIMVAYEIIIKGKNTTTNLYEITFNELGEIEKTQEIIQDKIDHLEF